MGRYGGRHGYNSLPGVLRTLWKNKAAPYVGVLGLIIPVVIYMYYCYIEAWCLGYAFRYATGAMDLGSDPAAYDAFFGSYVGAAEDGSASMDGTIFLVVCFVLNFVLLYRGLSKGIEWFCRWAMPGLLICALMVLVRVLTLGTPDPAHPEQSLLNGLGYMWNPWTTEKSLGEALANPEVWLAAAGQIFFSLSVGFGIIVTYASYLKPDDDIALSSVTASAGNGFAEVALGGLITVPAAFVFLGEAFVKSPPGTFGMGFVSLPSVFAHMTIGGVEAGGFFGFLFFFLLFLAAVTSSLSMLQPAIAFLEEGLGIGRRASVTLLGMVTAFGSAFVVFFSKDFKALDTLDFWVGSVFIYVLATVQVVVFAWVTGMEKGMAELNRGAQIRIPGFVRYIIQYIAPLYLLTIFGTWIYKEFVSDEATRLHQLMNDPVVQYSVGLIFVLLTLFLVLIRQAVVRWEKLEKEGQTP
jgi:SNF family Na+-dependent transporter